MFYADLHIHSKYSRATSRACDLEHLAVWAVRKGISVLGTGDFTHPAWLNEIKTKLLPAEPGLFRLRNDLEKTIDRQRGFLPPKGVSAGTAISDAGFSSFPVRFLLQVEISTIYKKGDLTRKVHHVICVPAIESAESIIRRLARIGNLNSDGRPILGLDSRNLLEITLESGADSMLIPAHIWTPWFSALGSKSGFDSIAECYGDLAAHIFAVETGLSSDPLMNWRVSALDRCRLVSNSDAHSPANLGREVCVFDTDLDYFAMRRALATGAGFKGTVEFFPEEGKYHLDGHRKCGVRLSPEETKQHGGFCPVCGKEVTVGVMNRVAELADRPAGTRPPGAAPFHSFIPLTEMLSEILGTGTGSNKVQIAYQALISGIGPELVILDHAPLEDIRRVGSPQLAEALTRMREGRVIRDAGFDGEYGAIRLFKDNELKNEAAGALLFDLPAPTTSSAPAAEPTRPSHPPGNTPPKPAGGIMKSRDIPAPPGRAGILDGLDPDQRRAAEITDCPLLIIAGPGAGKTRVLTHRIAHLVANHNLPPEHCLAITFTRRAAGEMLERLERLVPDQARRIPVCTFHALGYSMIRQYAGRLGLPAGIRVARDDERIRVLSEALSISERKARLMLAAISRFRRQGDPLATDKELVLRAAEVYRRAMRGRDLLDFDDLIGLPLELLETQPDAAAHYRKQYAWISVDEFQDIDEPQYRLVKRLVLPRGNLCAIGDPDQAIYGFRGTSARFFQRFTEDFPNTRTVQLNRNYRSGKAIVDASLQVIAPATLVAGRTLHTLIDDATKIVIHESPTDRAEAEYVVHTIEQLMGGTTFFSRDSGRVPAGENGGEFSFSDFGVLYRTDAQAATLCEAFTRSGMPFQKRSQHGLLETPGVLTLIDAMRDMPEGSPAERLDRTVARLAEETDQSDMKRCIQALRLITGRCADMETFLSDLALGVDVDLWDAQAECVSLLTLHAAKGLEFPGVFIVGCENGILPLRWGAADDANIDEERRLFFVGMSRAGKRLFLCHARKRLWQGNARPMEPSPFLLDIKDTLLERCRSEARPKKPWPPHEQLDLFDGS